MFVFKLSCFFLSLLQAPKFKMSKYLKKQKKNKFKFSFLFNLFSLYFVHLNVYFNQFRNPAIFLILICISSFFSNRGGLVAITWTLTSSLPLRDYSASAVSYVWAFFPNKHLFSLQNLLHKKNQCFQCFEENKSFCSGVSGSLHVSSLGLGFGESEGRGTPCHASE